jgi:acyl-CoA synthetase (AMP-forming)/AMP-acid ligase II
VVGRPDPEWQEAVCALVVLTEDTEVTQDDLRSHCQSSLAGHKVPKQFEFVTSLPRTASGKLLRGQLPESAPR